MVAVHSMSANARVLHRPVDVAVSPVARPVIVPVQTSASDENKDYFIEENGLRYAGRHLILDIWNAERLDELDHVEQALREAVTAAGATLLHIHLHHFTPNGGISGVAVLSESHISIHTWPEKGYAALDVFMCGDAVPARTVAVFRKAFGSECHVGLSELKRGLQV